MALARAQQICIIMSPLDMRGLVGAATIMGCLKYGTCFSGLDAQDDSVLILRLKDEDLLEAPDDSAFLQSLRLSCARVNGVHVPFCPFCPFTTFHVSFGILPSRRAFCSLLPSPGWASLWQSFALFPLSSLRQAKKY